MAWWDIYKTWNYNLSRDPLNQQSIEDRAIGGGLTSPGGVPDIRDQNVGGMTDTNFRQSNDFIDLQTVEDRLSRYKEYERLLSVPEVEMALTVIADEACIAGNTMISTLFDGYRTISWLEKRWQQDQKPFLTYCWDFEKEDYTLDWAYNPRKVKTEETVWVALDDGNHFVTTLDHRILLSNQEWRHAGDLREKDELIPFYKMPPHPELNNIKHNQFSRIRTNKYGWVNERQFVDIWKGQEPDQKTLETLRYGNYIANGFTREQIAHMFERDTRSHNEWVKDIGFTHKELRWLGKKEKTRKVIGVFPHKVLDVYDLSVKTHQNFCTDAVVMHNCQEDDDGNLFKILSKNEEVVKELETICFGKRYLNLNRNLRGKIKRLCLKGDLFVELLSAPEMPKKGVLKLAELPPEEMFKIVTNKDRVVEYQQSGNGPDIDVLMKSTDDDIELQKSTAIRFHPKQIIHFKLGDEKSFFYPYGKSIVEPARSPAHQLRLMEDAVMVYRLARSPERRVFYIDVQQLPPFKAEAFVSRFKDQFKKKKVALDKGKGGASAVEERWHPPAIDEDIWLPIRPGSNTRIETLPGATNLGEIGDLEYFQSKLFTALNFPKDYFNTDDISKTRITLSSQDARFARMIERIQGDVADGIHQLCETHLEMRGFPYEMYRDIKIKMTRPSPYKEISEMEVINHRLNIIAQLKGMMIMSDYDLLTRYWNATETDAEDIIARAKAQKMEDMKFQILGQNPALLGMGIPGQEGDENEMGTGADGPNPMLGPTPDKQPDGNQENKESPDEQNINPDNPEKDNLNNQDTDSQPNMDSKVEPLPIPSDEDLEKYNLELQDYDRYQDAEDIDFGTEEGL